MSASELSASVSASELSASVSASEPNAAVSASELSAPVLRVVRGDATPEEIAVLIAVLGARSGRGAAPTLPKPVMTWAAPHHVIRKPLQQGPGAWAASAWR